MTLAIFYFYMAAKRKTTFLRDRPRKDSAGAPVGSVNFSMSKSFG